MLGCDVALVGLCGRGVMRLVGLCGLCGRGVGRVALGIRVTGCNVDEVGRAEGSGRLVGRQVGVKVVGRVGGLLGK